MKKALFKKNQRLTELLRVLLERRIPFAAYRLPETSAIQILIQQDSFPEKITSFDQLEHKSGFIIAPFSEKTGHSAFLLLPDIVCLDGTVNERDFLKLSENNLFTRLKKTKNGQKNTTREDFFSNVNKIISGIHNADFQKVVLSKIKVEKTPPDFRAGNFFFQLCEKYPSAMVYLFQLPEAGCWAGATPEPLLITENNTAKTVALAGTQTATGKPIDQYEWTEKERQEQGFVVDFIESSLNRIGLNTYTKSEPRNIQAARLIHLQTTFEFPVSAVDTLASSLLRFLHPTPATGGLPQAEACKFILKNEQHDRRYYTGFLGVLNVNQKTNIYVNLRCVELFEKEYVLYSGGGITSSSVAEKEWEETENKIKTMQDVISV